MNAIESLAAEIAERLQWSDPPQVRNPYRVTGLRVLRAHDERPDLNSTQLGQRMGLNPAYVRKTLARNGRNLAR